MRDEPVKGFKLCGLGKQPDPAERSLDYVGLVSRE
jgi:hypothetical protein